MLGLLCSLFCQILLEAIGEGALGASVSTEVQTLSPLPRMIILFQVSVKVKDLQQYEFNTFERSIKMALILAWLHLKAPSHYDAEERVNLLFCSAVLQKHLSSYVNETTLAKFDSKGVFVDFETSIPRPKCVFFARIVHKN